METTIDINLPFYVWRNRESTAIEPTTQVKADSSCSDQLKANYDRLKERQMLFIQQNSWLQGNTHALGAAESLGSIEKDEKMLALLAGDGFICGTKWEGAKSVETLTYFDGLLDRFNASTSFELDQGDKRSLIKLKERFAESKKVAEKISGLVKPNGDEKTLDKPTLKEKQQRLNECAKELAEEYKQRVQKEGEAWLPLGWRSNDGNCHFVWCHFTKDSFSVVNTGSGLKEHPKVLRTVNKQVRDQDVIDGVEQQVFYQQHLTYEGVDKDKLFDPLFWQAMLESCVSAVWDSGRFYSSSFLYESAAAFLGGKKKKGLDSQRYPDLYQKGQCSGTCAMKGLTQSVFAELTGALDKKPNKAKIKKKKNLYKQMKWLWQSEALVRLAKQSLPKEEDTLSTYDLNSCTLERARLMKEVVENLRDAQKKLAQSGQPVPAAIVNGGSATLLEIELRLKRWQELFDQKPVTIETAALDFHSIKGENKVETATPAISSAFKEQQPQVKQENDLSARNSLPYPDSFYTALQRFHELSSPSISTKADLLGALKDQLAALSIFDQQESFHTRQNEFFTSIDKMVLSLPLPNESKGAPLWGALEAEERALAMELLYQLLEKSSILKNNHQASSSVAVYSLIVCIDYLARLDPAAKMQKAPQIRYQSFLREVVDKNFTVESHHVHQKLSSILHYFSPEGRLKGVPLESDQWQLLFQRFLLEPPKLDEKEALKSEADSLFSFVTVSNGFGLFNIALDKEELKNSPTLLYFAQFLEDEQIKAQLRKKILSQPGRNKEDVITPQELLVSLTSEPFDANSLLPKSVHIAMRAAIAGSTFVSSVASLKTTKITEAFSNPIKWFKYGDKWLVALSCDDKVNNLLRVDLAGNGESRSWFGLQNEVMTNKTTVSLGETKLDQELSREFKMIGVDPYQEAHRALSFFGDRLDLLQEEGSCKLVFYHLSRVGRIATTEHDGGQFQQEAILFFDKALRYYAEHNYWQTWLELAQVADWFFGYLHEAGRYSPQEPWTNIGHLIEEQGNLLAKSAPDRWKHELKAKFAATQLSLYKSSFFIHPSEQQKKKFLKDFFSYCLTLRTSKTTTPHSLSAKKVDQAYRLYAIEWLKQMGEEEKNSLFCHLAAFCDVEGRSGSWLFDEASLRAVNIQGVPLEIDLVEGKAILAGDESSFSVLPLQLLNSEQLQKLLPKGSANGSANGSAIGRVIEKEKGVFLLPDHGLKVWSTDQGGGCFQKAFEGRLYQLSSHSSALHSLFEPLKDEEANYWLHFDHTSQPEKMHLLVEKEGSKLWEASIIVDEQGSYRIEELIKEGQRLVRFDQLDPSLQTALSATGLEDDKKYIYGWGSLGGSQVEKIILPRCSGLSFTIKKDPTDGRMKAYCDKLTGFYLDPNQSVEGLPSDTKRCVVKDNFGNRFVILQHSSIEFKIAQMANNDLDTYKIVGKKLEPLDFEGAIRLAHLYLTQNHHDKINSLFPRHARLLRGYTESEEKLLNNFIHHCLSYSGQPKICSTTLKLLIELERNRLKYGRKGSQQKGSQKASESTDIDFLKLLNLYKLYQRHQGNLLEDKLSADEELFFLEMIPLRSKLLSFAPEAGKSDDSMIASLELFGLSKRYLYLKTGQVSFKDSKVVDLEGAVNKIKSLNQKKQNQIISVSELQKSFTQFLNKEGEQPVEELFFNVTKKNFQDFSEHFWSYYAIATEGSPQERSRLRSLLLLNKHLIDASQGEKVDYLYWQLLLSALDRPKNTFSKLPTVTQLKKLSQLKNKNKFEKKLRLLSKRSSSFNESRFQSFKNKFSFNASFGFAYIKSSLASFFMKNKKKPDPRLNAKPTLYRWNQPSLTSLDVAFKTRLTALASSYFDSLTQPCSVAEEPLAPIPENEPIEPSVRQKVDQVAHDLNSWRLQKKQQSDTSYTLKADKTIEQLKQELLKEVTYWQGQLKSEVIALGALAQGERQQGVEGLTCKGGGRRRPLSWGDLEALFATRDKMALPSKCYLDQEQVGNLQEGYAQLLVKAVRLQQMQQALAIIDELLRQPEGSQEQAVYIQRLVAQLMADRHYELNEQMRTRLQFEAKNGSFYRPAQTDKLEQVKEIKAVRSSLEAPTGFGKTAIMTPTLDEELGDESLVINVLPAAIEETNVRHLSKSYQECYGRGVDRIAFDRNSSITAAGLELIYEDMTEDIRQGKPMNIRADSLRSMELHLLILLHKVEQGGMTMEQRRSIIALVKILRLMRCSSVAIIDEERLAMNPLDKLVYAVGKASTMPSEHVELIDTIFSLLPSAVGLGNKERSFLSDAQFKEQAALPVVKAMAQRLTIEEAQFEEYQAFVLDAKLPQPSWLAAHPNSERICLLRGMMTKILPESLKGSVDLNFGLSKLHFRSNQGNKEFAIPYRSSNTPKENKVLPSVYKCPRTTLTRTYITYYEKGLTKEQALDALKMVQSDAKMEMLKKNIDVANTSAGQIFATGLTHQPPLSLLSLTDSQLKEIADQFQHNKPLIRYYLKGVVASQIEVYDTSLVSTVQNMRSQFAKSVGLSATPPSPASVGINTVLIPMEGTSESALDLMLAKCAQKKTLHTLDGNPLEATIEKAHQDGSLRVIVDVGAFGRGKTSQEVARLICDRFKQRKEISQVVYFDENKELFYLLNTATGVSIELDEKTQDLQERFTYFDQARSCGSDLKQLLKAVALITVGIKTTRADLQQGMGRMRELAGQQGAEIALHSQVAEQLFGQKEIPSMGALLQKLLINEAKEELHDNYLSQLQQLENSVRNGAISHLLGLIPGKTGLKGLPNIEAKVDVAAMIKRWSSYKELFLQKQSQSAYLLYGQPEKEVTSVEALQGYKKVITTSKSLAKMPSGRHLAVKRELDAIEKEWGPSMPLPAKVKQGAVDLEDEMEFFADLECKTENQQEQEAEVKENIRDKRFWPEKLDLFENHRWNKPVNIRSLAFKVKKIAVKALTYISKLSLVSFILIGSSFIWIGMSGVIAVMGLVSLVVLPPSGILLLNESLVMFICACGAFLAGMILYTPQAILQRMHKERTSCFYQSVQLIDQLPKPLKPLSKFFSKELLVSENFCQQKIFRQQDFKQQKLFSSEHKPLFQLLIIQDKAKGAPRLQVVAIDQNDSAYFHRRLKEDRMVTSQEKAGKRKRKIAIVDVDKSELGRAVIMAQGKNGFTQGELENNTTFKRLLLEAKVIRGKTELSPEELNLIDQKVKKAGLAKALKTLYNDYLLKRSPLRRKAFEGSALVAHLQKS